MRISSFLATLVLAGLACVVDCSEELVPPEPDRPTIDSATFARALADIVVARVELLPDTAAYERRTEEILRGHGVTDADLREFVQVHGQNDDLMTRAYARVEARLDSIYPTGQPDAATGVPIGALGAPDTVTPPP
jgi:hypothetical protein